MFLSSRWLGCPTIQRRGQALRGHLPGVYQRHPDRRVAEMEPLAARKVCLLRNGGREAHRSLKPAAVDEDPVRRSEIPDHPERTRGRHDHGVLTGDLGIVDHKVTALVPPDKEPRATYLNRVSWRRTCEDRQPHPDRSVQRLWALGHERSLPRRVCLGPVLVAHLPLPPARPGVLQTQA